MKAIGVRCILAAFTLALLLGNEVQGAIITSLYNTGVDDSKAVLSDGTTDDPHYTLIITPDGSTSETMVRTSVGGYPINGAWLGDDECSISAWIGPNNPSSYLNSLHGPQGAYTYRTTFDLTGFDPATASITGQWASDNTGTTIVLNDETIFTGSGSYGSWTDFSYAGPGFISGVNTLDFIVVNASGGSPNPTGLRVEMVGTANEVPEPATLAIWSLGALGCAFAGYRRKKQAV